MKSEYHVLHLRSSAGLYGAEYVILGLLPELAQRGIDSTLLCLDNQYLDEQPLYTRARALGLPAERLPCRGRFDFATVAALRERLRTHPKPLLHVHDYKSALTAWLARGRAHVPIVATSHGQFSSTTWLHLYHLLELSMMRRFERVCIVSAEMRPLLSRAGVREANIVLIENGIDTRRFSPGAPPLARRDFDIDDGSFVFGAAMRLTEQKNPLGLIEAFARVAEATPRAMLVIAGDGPLREAVKVRAAELGLSNRLRLIGARDDLERFYTMLDAFVLPSLYEGLPLALLEAMAAGRPIVATDVGEVGAVLDGSEGTLVPPADCVALAGAMQRAMTRTQSGDALRARVVERYSVQRMADDYAAVYQDVWGRHARIAA